MNGLFPATHLKTIIAALEAFSIPCHLPRVGDLDTDTEKHFRYVEVFENGRPLRFILETVCSIAAKELGRRDSDGAKFRRLVDGLRAQCLSHLYEEIMKEPMP